MSSIRINRFPNLKLTSVPGHYGIVSNEFVDSAANNAGSQPLYFTDNLSRKDLNRQIYRHCTEIDKFVPPQHTERSTKRKIQNMRTYIEFTA